MTVLPALRAELASATGRLLATAAALSDADVTAPSLLPGWTRGHVLAHLAQNADSYVNLLTWAATGVRTPQYPSAQAREEAVEAAASLPAARLLAELEEGAERFAAAVRGMPDAAWQAQVEGMRPPPHPAWYVLVRRLREVGVHHVDLDAGYGPADWPEEFVRRELHDCLRCWPRERSAIGELHLRRRSRGREMLEIRPGLGQGPAVEGTPADMLAWLTGRSRGEGVSLVPVGQPFMPGPAGVGLPAPPPWLTMPAPADLPATPPKDYP
ncbi:maleylpyruvate isomerase family mycothiol-dependent enzyme [Actinomadura sp. ATCC 31491]|uniref:Maleylpyruvate isomerase family mycothiol-dependent enzyme n=1 Tax=Actinomadura luzonensis TaxID=2805427 RepID=A0ABT0FWH2_9ACTN|nr:maleylpyruvate isomerase family mycothiol-dependent enzyme [Actinomadura luzonensis]MCK2216614.1 maleylpyruvate isomerase family mycothiol-dependent enzyme [Actinomadura luzonensis]